LVDEIVELNMPHKPNPFQNWNTIDVKKESSENYGVTRTDSQPNYVKSSSVTKKTPDLLM
jgi:hypothetical protein